MVLRYANRPREVRNVFATSLLTWGSDLRVEDPLTVFYDGRHQWTRTEDSRRQRRRDKDASRSDVASARRSSSGLPHVHAGAEARALRRRHEGPSPRGHARVPGSLAKTEMRLPSRAGDVVVISREKPAQVCLNIPSRHFAGHSTTCSTVARNTSHGIVLVYDVALIICISPS